MKTRIHIRLGLLAAMALSTLNPQLAAAPLGTAITYQGQLTDGTNPANGRYDFTFTLYDEATAGRLVAGPLTNSRLNVVDGLFTVTLDFRADVFGSQARWLSLAVRSSGLSPFIPLSPRQPLTPTPQALYAANAGDAALLDGQGAASYVAKAGDTMTGPLVVPANGFRAGTDQLVLTGGNVGIGTTSPGALLGLLGDVGGDQILLHAGGSHTAGAWLSLENTSTDGKRWDFISTGAGNGGGAGNLLFRQAAVGSVLTLTPQGRAGVGTLSPIAKLDVVDEAGTDTLIRAESSRTAGSTLALVNTDTGGMRWDVISTGSGNSGGAGKLLFRQAGGDPLLTLTGDGFVGVANAMPDYPLDVGDPSNSLPLVIRAQSSASYGSGLCLQNTQPGGKAWWIVSTGPDNFAGAGSLQFHDPMAGTLLALTPAGRMGVGTIYPSNRLQVVAWFGSASESAFRVDRHGDGPVAEFVRHQEPAGPLTFHAIEKTNYFIACRFRFTGGLGQVSYPMVFSVDESGDVLGQDFFGLSFNPSSDRNAKENIAAIDPAEMLEKVAALPISKWNFKGDDATPHVGPMAQDFHAAFGVGPDDKHIATVDADGVALAAIQGLNQKVEDRSQESEARSQKLEARNSALEKEVAALKALVQTLAEKVNGGGQ